MIISVSDISRAFDDLISGVKSREAVANWATQLRMADDSRELIYEPPLEKSRIWRGLIYLTGVDLKTSSAVYLHCVEDFLAFRQETCV